MFSLKIPTVLKDQLSFVEQWQKDCPHPIDSLRKGCWVKLICGASFQDLPLIRNLSFLSTLVGVDCIDCAADAAVLHAVDSGIMSALEFAKNNVGVRLCRPLVMISINDDDDPHFRKATFDTSGCLSHCFKPCEKICPAAAISLKAAENGNIIPFIEGVTANKCYGCGRCVPVCPVNNIETYTFNNNIHLTVDSLIQTYPINAIEIHTRAQSIEHFQHLWSHIHSITNLSLVAVSFPDSGELLEPFLRQVESMICTKEKKYDIIWQTDGRPMSGDLGKGTTWPCVKLAKKVLTFGLDGYVQCSGGVNDYTVSLLTSLDLLKSNRMSSSRKTVSGVAFGSYVRKEIMKIFQQGLYDCASPVESLPCFEEAWKKAFNIIKPMKARD
eukprot:jgi/Galph1/5511/GphlegSOOS_G4190.1